MPRLPILTASLFLPMTLLSAQTPSQQYSYDAVGNMTSALPDGILSISYNNLNLPETVVLSSGSTRRIEQLYSAGGDKLGRDGYDQSGARVSHRSYVGPLVLENGVPVMLLVDGGYISIGTQNGEYSGDYHFFVGDHQGNVRAVVGEDGTIEQTVHYDPFGEMAVDNLSPNWYLYSGKEWDLNQQAYDFGARIYMPAHSRFTTIDPLCEQDYRTSPYAYCRNNPVNLVDPDGQIHRKIIRRESIIIKADYLTKDKQSYESAKQGIAFWNRRTEDVYIDDSGKQYSVIYKLSVTMKNPVRQHTVENTYSVVPKESELLRNHNNAVGTTKMDKDIYIAKEYSITNPYTKKSSSTPAHEIGHTLGLKHEDHTVMSEYQDNKRVGRITQEQINTIVNTAIDETAK